MCKKNYHDGLHRHIETNAFNKDTQRSVALDEIIDGTKLFFHLFLLLSFDPKMLLGGRGQLPYILGVYR